ncbi:hypothetical protein [Devosia sp.]|uniref:hypothetical protein n=1 Tax=Devosia sp. TaxID=1871048 RepID=UPI0032665F13
MRKLLPALLVLLVLPALVSTGHAAETYPDPKALVTAIYAAYQPGQFPPDPAQFYSVRLAGLVAQHQESAIAESASTTAVDNVPPAAPLNPFLPDKSALISGLVIGEPTQIGDTALINVSYHNFDQPRLLSIALVQDGDAGWKVDDVASVGHDEHWLLSWVLTYDPQGF